MGALARLIFKGFPTWERPVQIGLIIGMVLLPLLLFTALQMPADSRWMPLAAFFSVILSMQGIVMWANRGMVTPYTRAQRLFLRGEMRAARDVLLAALESGEAQRSADLLTLLGNVYRQLGDLDASAAALQEALAMTPNYHFPLYSFGRTLLVQGDYVGAAAAIQRASEVGAPDIVLADLGEALYRQGQSVEQVVSVLHNAEALAAHEAHRLLMVHTLLHHLGVGPPPDTPLIAAGRPYWEAAAQRFAQTPYGAAVAAELHVWDQWQQSAPD